MNSWRLRNKLQNNELKAASNNSMINPENIFVNCSINELFKYVQYALFSLGYSEYETNITTQAIMYAELRGNNQGIVKLLSGSTICE